MPQLNKIQYVQIIALLEEESGRSQSHTARRVGDSSNSNLSD